MGHPAAFQKALQGPVRQFRRASMAAGEAWCQVMHDEISWPMYGMYQCRRCLRCYRVPWDEPLVDRTPVAAQTAVAREVRAVRPVTA